MGVYESSGTRPQEGKEMAMTEPATNKTNVEQAIEEFTRENPGVVEALEVFGIATAEYGRAIQALYPSETYTGTSTQPTQ